MGALSQAGAMRHLPQGYPGDHQGEKHILQEIASMKKAGIITFHNAENYGAALQTYALMKTIANLGFDCEVIDYRNPGVFYRNLVKTIYYLLTCQNPIGNHRAYKHFQQNYLNLTEKKFRSAADFENKADHYDYLFFGSDQIWNPDLSGGFDPVYFAQFTTQARKIAYAASFGKDQVSPQEQQTLNRLISGFDAIAVREETLLPFIDQQADCVLDPCLLLSANDWKGIANDQITAEDYILVYQLHPNKAMIDAALQLANVLKKKVFLLSPYLIFKHRDKIQKLGRITPNEFLAYYDQADLVVSDSFHGTIFSILFEKAFYTILPSAKTGRITSLLRKLDLTERVIDQNEIPRQEIHYAKVNRLLNEEIQSSMAYLHRTLE
jgi:hypothetical protein